MKRLALAMPLLLAALVAAPAAAQAQQTPARTTQPAPRPAPEPTRPTTATPSAVERDLRVFSDWVNDKVDRVDAAARRELPRLMDDFDRQSARIDKSVDSLSAQGKREYAEKKARYKDWAIEQERLDAQARKPETAQQTQDRLLGEQVVLGRARAIELPELYGRFIETVRDQRRTWTATDWSAASAVLTRMNARYEQVREQIPLEERVRIRSWQGEFRTMEKARDVKEAMAK